jgi:hypothetical protein
LPDLNRYFANSHIIVTEEINIMKKRFRSKRLEVDSQYCQNPILVHTEGEEALPIELPDRNTDKSSDEKFTIESSGRRHFLQSSILIAGGALATTSEIVQADYSKTVFDQDGDNTSLTSTEKSYNSNSTYRNTWDLRSSRGDTFKELLMSKLDSSLWPPEALRPDYTSAAYPQIVVPADGIIYEDARQTYNIRYQRYPVAIFYALNTNQVQEAVMCAVQLNLRISPAGGRNSFLSMATPDGHVVIDLSHMKDLSLDIPNMIATAGPGATGPMINDAVFDAKIPGLTIASGVCGFVGVVPFTLGGGLGFLGHRLGLGCDNLVSLEMVLADGSIVKVDQQNNPDLFWASCGGGGGTFGIVTSISVKLHILPNNGNIYAFSLTYTGKRAFVKGFSAFQDWFPTASDLWGFDLPGLAPVRTGTPNPSFSFLSFYFGSEEDAIADLTAAGLLFDLGGSVNFVKMGNFDSYHSWYINTQLTSWMGGAGQPGTPAAIINGLSMNSYGQPFMVQAMQNQTVGEALYNGRETVNGLPSSPFLGTQVIGGKYYHGNWYVNNRFLDKVPIKTIASVADFLFELSKACIAGSTVHGLVYAGGHMLGGAYANKRPSDTAFFWRKKIFVFFFAFQIPPGYREILDDEQYQLGKQLANDLLNLFSPPGNYNQAAYVNYQQEKFPNWQYGYFGSNYTRLQKVKAKYDPNGSFDKKFTVKGS